MAVIDPIPATDPYGKGDWTDYVSNWREKDAEWMQARTILRYQTVAQRTTDLGASPGTGRVTYNQANDRLELYSSTNAWKPLTPLPVNIKIVTDDATTVALAHASAVPADRGLVIGKDNIAITHVLRTQDGVLVADTTGLAIKTGTKTAKLTTDANNLVSDTPVSMPSLVLSGTGPVINTNQPVTVGALTAASGTVTGTLGVSGALTGGVGSSIGNVGLSGGVVTAVAATTSTDGGVVSGAGHFYGGTAAAVMRQRNTTSPFAWGAASIAVQAAAIEVAGAPMNIRNGMTVSDTTISYYSSGSFRGYISPAFYGDPGVGVVPEGSILIQ